MKLSKSYEVVSLTFFKEWHELCKKHKLTMEQYGQVVYAMCEYSFHGEVAELPLPGGIIFEMSQPFIDSSNRRKTEGHNGGLKAKGNSGASFANKNASKKKV